MKISLSGTSIVEAMVVLLVVVSGIVGVFGIMNSSTNLASSTAHRIEAIQIARDGLEAFTNIRNTNWKLYSADYANCWNTLNYQNLCIGDDGNSYDINHTSSEGLILSKNANNQFILTKRDNTGDYTDNNYRDNFKVQKDVNGFYTQDGGIDITPLFTRELQIAYIEDTNGDSTIDSNDSKMRVTAIIQWNDLVNNEPRQLEMDILLTNWKAEK